MGRISCPYCSGNAKKYGKTKAGSQRWKCSKCNATFTRKIDNTAKLLKSFLGWLMSGKRQADMPGKGRSFRRKCKPFWEVWPLPLKTGEIHRVIYVDGIHISRSIVVLIACTDDFVIGWYLARSETSAAWKALLSPIPQPDMVVTDGGKGFEKARKAVWPKTRVQRCIFHAFNQVKKQTTTRPNLPAGVELYGLAKQLLSIRQIEEASEWLIAFNAWCERWKDFLSEKTLDPETNRWEWTHARLVTARNGLENLIRKDWLFTFLDPQLTKDGSLPSMNNRIEGGVNAQLREMLRRHRGLSDFRRVKAVYWWCYMHSERPLGASETLKSMPTDSDIAELYNRSFIDQEASKERNRWGDGLVWSELHHSAPWRIDWD